MKKVDFCHFPPNLLALRTEQSASSSREVDGLRSLLRGHPNLLDHRDFIHGYTALHWAAKRGNLNVVKLLAGSYSAHVNAKSNGGYTPLHLACQFGHRDVFDILVERYDKLL